jgi:hypothetical protein
MPRQLLMGHEEQIGATRPTAAQKREPPDLVVPFLVTVDGSNKTTMVELRGLEPLTPCMPCRCATSCATAPNSCSFRIILRKQLDYLKPQSCKTPIRPRAADAAVRRRRPQDQSRHRKQKNPPESNDSGGLFGGAEGTRTPDPLHAMQVRYQLRHSPEFSLLRHLQYALSGPVLLSGSLRSNSNILEQPFRKFQIGHIRRRQDPDYSTSEETAALADVSSPS